MTSPMSLNMLELYRSGLYSDLTLTCGDREFQVHRVILHAKSSVFRKLLSGKFQESATAASRIDLPDDNPAHLQTLIAYLYSSEYSDAARNNDVELYGTFAVHIYAIADKYDFAALRDNSAKQLDVFCDPAVVMKDFVSALRVIENCTNPKDSTLWDIVLPKVQANLGILLEDESFKQLVIDKPDFTFRFLGLIAAENNKSPRAISSGARPGRKTKPWDPYLFRRRRSGSPA